jgi:2-hydroxy-3-keto-5-methylthiopentenyl-1-phosphate phosphatase
LKDIKEVIIINPVFKEYIQFLKDNNINYPLVEGFYWLDNQIIKAFDKKGDLQKILKINISDNLKVSFKLYNNNNKLEDLQSW